MTGASGFIGARICRRAADEGATVHGVSRVHHEAADLIRWEQADLTEHRAVDAVMRRVRPDIVLHLASEVSGSRDRDLVLPMLRANLLAAVNMMLASCEIGCRRFVLAGSMEEPESNDPDSIVQSPYAAAKAGALAYARFFEAVHGLPLVHLRIFMVYGPGQRDLRKLVPQVTVSLLRGQAPKLTSGSRPIDWVYVDDVVDAFMKAALADGADGTSVDIGSGTAVTVREVVNRVRVLVGAGVTPDFGAIPDRELERVSVADPSGARDLIGWRPSTPLEEGLERTVDFYRSELDRLPRLGA